MDIKTTEARARALLDPALCLAVVALRRGEHVSAL